MSKKISTSLWFDNNAEQAVEYYLSLFPGAFDDRFGLSWQIVPNGLMKLMSDPDPVKSGRVANAMMGMKKLDLPAFERAYAGANP